MANRVLNIPESELSQQEKDILNSLAHRKQLGHWLVLAIKEHIQRVNPKLRDFTTNIQTISTSEDLIKYLEDIKADPQTPENKKTTYMLNVIQDQITKLTENFTKTVIINKETGQISVE